MTMSTLRCAGEHTEQAEEAPTSKNKYSNVFSSWAGLPFLSIFPPIHVYNIGKTSQVTSFSTLFSGPFSHTGILFRIGSLPYVMTSDFQKRANATAIFCC